MKTANISLNVQAVQSRGMDKSASVKDKSFENFFSKNTANTSEKAQPANVKTSGKKEITDGFDSHKITVKADKNQTPVENEMPTEEIAEKVTTLLQNVFGLSKEDVEDLLEQLGITPMDLIVDVTGAQQLQATGNTSNINALIWKIPVQCLYRMNLLPIGCRSHRGFLKFWNRFPKCLRTHRICRTSYKI